MSELKTNSNLLPSNAIKIEKDIRYQAKHLKNWFEALTKAKRFWVVTPSYDKKYLKKILIKL